MSHHASAAETLGKAVREQSSEGNAQKAGEVDEDAARKAGSSQLEVEFFDEESWRPSEKYRRDELTPSEYHSQRAKILAEP